MRRVEALEELREALNLESLPIRIECYDISHAMGQDPVGSMVVFQDALPKKADYRKFGIKTGRQDDFAAMAEVISRRFARLSDGTGETHDTSFAAAPNLVVIDGGKGQLSAALDAMQAYDLPRVAVIALAKRIEEVFVPGQPDPIVLSRHSPGCSCSSASATRRTGSRSASTGSGASRADSRSIFDDLEGVGPARRRALLQHFGSVEQMLAATPEELEGVPGVPPTTARRIYAQLHKAGRSRPGSFAREHRLLTRPSRIVNAVPLPCPHEAASDRRRPGGTLPGTSSCSSARSRRSRRTRPAGPRSRSCVAAAAKARQPTRPRRPAPGTGSGSPSAARRSPSSCAGRPSGSGSTSSRPCRSCPTRARRRTAAGRRRRRSACR